MNIFKKFFGTSKKNEMAQDECQQDLSDNKLEVEEKLSDKQKEYISKFTEDDTPGWTAIDNELSKFYEENSERHYGTILKYVLGGKDPIDGFSIYDNNEQVFHRHIISYGMSELYYEPEAADNEFSKWGFEFTMRIAPYENDEQAEKGDGTIVEHEPLWVTNLMQNLARYVFETEKWFDAYHFIPTNSPIKADTDTKLVGIAFVPDTRLDTIETANGKVQFLQMVGLTQKELDWLWEDPKTARVQELINRMREDNPLLIVDLNREKDYV